MKRIISIILLLALVLGLVGCGSSSTDETVPSAQSASNETKSTDAEATVESTVAPTDVVLLTYPLNVARSYAGYAARLPDHIYTTTGSENGLAGTIYTFNGTVEEIITYSDESGVYAYEDAIVITENGPVMITNLYKTIYGAIVSTYGASTAKETYSDNVGDYIFPDKGESGQFIVVYMGYSSSDNVPVFILGASPSIFEMGEYIDPVANSTNPLISAELQSAPVYNGSRTNIIGQYAFINISKATLQKITEEQYAEFCEIIVDNSGYNWVSIICDDGTGIQFAGSQYIFATYGTLDHEGIIIDCIGDIMLTGDGFSYEAYN